MSLNDFEMGKELGKGAFGSVCIVKRKEDNKTYAMKRVKMGQLNTKERENSLNEVRILASLNHTNIIGYKEAFYDEASLTLNIVMEYADDGDMETKIKFNKKHGLLFRESTIWDYLIQTLKGLQFLHENHIMHRDIKSANLFLMKDGTVKIGDLNVSKIAKMDLAYTQIGTPYYASPEIWADKAYDYKSDIWSVGVIIYELCQLRPPFRGTSIKQLSNNINKGVYEPISHFYSKELGIIIQKMLAVNPSKRPTTDMLLKDDIIVKKMQEINNIDGHCSLYNDDGNKVNLIKTIKIPKNMKEINRALPMKRYNNWQREEMMMNDEYETKKNGFKNIGNNENNDNNNKEGNINNNKGINNSNRKDCNELKDCMNFCNDNHNNGCYTNNNTNNNNSHKKNVSVNNLVSPMNLANNANRINHSDYNNIQINKNNPKCNNNNHINGFNVNNINYNYINNNVKNNIKNNFNNNNNNYKPNLYLGNENNHYHIYPDYKTPMNVIYNNNNEIMNDKYKLLNQQKNKNNISNNKNDKYRNKTPIKGNNNIINHKNIINNIQNQMHPYKINRVDLNNNINIIKNNDNNHINNNMQKKNLNVVKSKERPLSSINQRPSNAMNKARASANRNYTNNNNIHSNKNMPNKELKISNNDYSNNANINNKKNYRPYTGYNPVAPSKNIMNNKNRFQGRYVSPLPNNHKNLIDMKNGNINNCNNNNYYNVPISRKVVNLKHNKKNVIIEKVNYQRSEKPRQIGKYEKAKEYEKERMKKINHNNKYSMQNNKNNYNYHGYFK